MYSFIYEIFLLLPTIKENLINCQFSHLSFYQICFSQQFCQLFECHCFRKFSNLKLKDDKMINSVRSSEMVIFSSETSRLIIVWVWLEGTGTAYTPLPYWPKIASSSPPKTFILPGGWTSRLTLLEGFLYFMCFFLLFFFLFFGYSWLIGILGFEMSQRQ